MLGKLVGGIMDNFKAADIDITGNMKVKSLQKEFKENFGVTLRVYNGVKFADGDKTLGSFKSANTKGEGIRLKAKMKVSDVESAFMNAFGIKVQIADAKDTHLVPNNITIGEARRGEYEKK